MSRRDVLKMTGGAAMAAMVPGQVVGAALAAPMAATTTMGTVDRRTVVRRHNPVVTELEPFSALTVGNGEFAFTADVSGLQTFPEIYEKTFPLCTAAHWAWHTTPLPRDLAPEQFRFKEYGTYGRPVPYATDSKGQEPLFNWLRENPHRMRLGRIGLELPSREITNAKQTLDLWSGLLVSRFEASGQPVQVETCCHPDRDMLTVRVRSPLIAEKKLGIVIAFAYPSPQRPMADWNVPAERHASELDRVNQNRALVRRKVDDARYHVLLEWSAQASLEKTKEHQYRITSVGGDAIELTCLFAQSELNEQSQSVDEVQSAAAKHWERFWSTGGAIDLSGSTHPQSPELERRIVLSQYNTALHCAGSLPSQETGLLCNSWYGKFHLEMHWYHSAHFVAWDRFGRFERTLGYYEKILPEARRIAQQQGYRGARWPKMVGPEGKDSPSPVGPLLIWQQPHPIYYAELCYHRYRDRATLERWRTIVGETAEFMASYAQLVDHRYVLGPPMKTVSENADTLTTRNPTFELAYWRFGLSIAQQWRERRGEPRNAPWDVVLAKLSPLPVQDGMYLMQEGMIDTYTKWNWEHPALLMPASMLPTEYYDRETMRRTVRKVMEVWQWDRAWGWDFGVAAMAAARVGEPELAVNALLIDSVKNRYHPNGHNYQRENLTAYLPGNGSLLAAVATMAATNSFAQKDWQAKWENLSLLM